MKNRWNPDLARLPATQTDVGMRVYTSNLLGEEEDLVLHGGGNTSCKGQVADVFGEMVNVLFVKGSGWDLRTIKEAGFPPVNLDYLLQLSELESLSDSEMMRQLRLALLNPTAPTPSVEAILHALIPQKFVDHSHADAVVTISNSPNGEAILAQIYGDDVLILPYIMPGFILARQVLAAARTLDWSSIKGIILMHHGIFSFADDAQESYTTMIDLVNKAEDYLAAHAGEPAIASAQFTAESEDILNLSLLRKQAGELFGGPILARLDASEEAAGFATRDNCGELATRGPLTPDHTIHAKAFAAIFDADPLPGLAQFAQNYRDYFTRYAGAEHQCLDPMPRYGVWRERGMIYLAPNRKRLEIIADITRHTVRAIQQAEAIGGWQALPQADLFAVEYWELEQAKLKSSGSRAAFEGKVAVVTGAASGIGKACVDALLAQGAAVVALDVAEDFAEQMTSADLLALHCDVTSETAIRAALHSAVQTFGGVDVLISNAGVFPPSQSLENMNDAQWQASLDLNLTSHMRLMRACIPFLRNGFDPAVVIVGSKNVPAPGPGAAAYSAAKAGLAQLARVAALELGKDGIRVNTVHPNAVYDTALWTDEILASRAANYGLTVDEYKTANVLGTPVCSADVAAAVLALASQQFACTTGAQLPVDGGNERVI